MLVGFARGIARSNPPNEGRAPILTLSTVIKIVERFL